MNKQTIMVIDLERCIGCQSCAVGCHIDHSLKDGTYWCEIKPLEGDKLYKPAGKYPDIRMGFIPRQCFHCSEPVCLAACPAAAISKTAEGAVVIDNEKCIGCGTCSAECPYGVPVLDEKAEKSSKCTMCADRLRSGEKPFCVDGCPAGARFCGTHETLSGVIKSRKGYRLLEEKGTQPNLYYLPKR